MPKQFNRWLTENLILIPILGVGVYIALFGVLQYHSEHSNDIDCTVTANGQTRTYTKSTGIGFNADGVLFVPHEKEGDPYYFKKGEFVTDCLDVK